MLENKLVKQNKLQSAMLNIPETTAKTLCVITYLHSITQRSSGDEIWEYIT